MLKQKSGNFQKRTLVTYLGFFFALIFCAGITAFSHPETASAANYYVNAKTSDKFHASYARNFIDLMDATSVSKGSNSVNYTSNLLGTVHGSNPGGAAGYNIAGYYAKNTSYDCSKYYVTFKNGAFSWQDGWLDVKVCPRTSDSDYAWAVGQDGQLYDFRQDGDNKTTYFRFRFYKHGTNTQVNFNGIFYTTDNDGDEGHKITGGSLAGTWLYSSNTTISRNSDDWWLGNRDCGTDSGEANPLYCKVWFEVSGTTGSPISIGYRSESVSRTSGIGIENNEYEGKSKVGSASNYSGDTGWTNACTSSDITNGLCTVSYETDCANSGCPIKIQHRIKQNEGLTGTSHYEISRKLTGQSSSTLLSGMMNYYSYRNDGSSWQNTKRNDDGKAIGETTVTTSSITLLPGQKVCETFKFNKRVNPNSDAFRRTKACANAKVTNFAGKSKISGTANGENATAGTRKIIYIDESNCPTTTGCTVKFEHEMSRSGSIGTSDWQVSRTSNASLMEPSRRIASNADVGHGTFNQDDGWKRVNGPNGNFTIYPGMVLCEKLTYKPSNDATKTVNNTYTEICAAVKKGAPADSGAFIDIKVKNNQVTKYNEYQSEVYAKPGDTLSYKATYNPYPQDDYQLIPEQMRIDNGTIYPNNSINTSSTLQKFFNAHKGSLSDWNNAFSIHYSINTGSFGTGTLIPNGNYTYTIGSSTTKNPTPNTRTVAHSNAGHTIDERAKTNVNSVTKTTPSAITYTEGSITKDEETFPTLVTNVSTADKEAFAYARIPYNFTTSVKIPNDDKEDVINAGEDYSVKYDLSLNPKRNDVTTNDSSKYTTRADDVNRKLIVYNPATIGGKKAGGTMSGGRNANICSTYFGLPNDEVTCGYSEPLENDIEINNNNEMKDGKTISNESRKFYIQDLPAGSRVCVAVAVFPASSGADTNWNSTNYSNSWQISNSKCFIIAKKPSLQVWGGNTYTNGKINTSVANKYNVSGYTNYKVGTASSNRYIFGSWSELGLIAGSTIQGFASAAATGYSANYSGEIWPAQTYLGASGTPADYRGRGNNTSAHFSAGPGGLYVNTTSFCLRSKLTISNKNCSGGSAGELGLASAVVHTDKDKNAVKAKFIQPNLEQEKANSGNAGNRSINLSSNENYYYSSDQLSIPAAIVTTYGTPKIVHAKNITIEGNIQYGTTSADTIYYTSLESIPKLVIYADENININCNVSRIDALLIADNSVITCNNYANTGSESGIKNSILEHINDAQNSNQLTVNGAIITKVFRANRTYGAATGANSIIPAELINFDPSLYLWGNDSSNSEASSGAIETNYIRELSPRK